MLKSSSKYILIWKILIRSVLFLFVFSGTALIVNAISNRGSRNAYVELSGTALPVVFTCVDGEMISPLPAYKQDMDSALLRDGVIPLVGEERTVTVYVEERAYPLQNITYELRNPVDGNLIEEGEMNLLGMKNGRTGYEATLRMDMKRKKEYTFVVLADTMTGEKLHFYAKVLRLEKEELRSFMSGAMEFHSFLLAEKTEEQKNELARMQNFYPPEEYNRTDLGSVSLASEYETLTWGEMKPEISGEIVIALTEIAEDSATLALRYKIFTVDEELKELTYYDVEEYFSMEFVPELAKARVVNYFRKVREAFRNTDFEREINGVNLGLSDREPRHLLTEDNEHMLLVQDGCVWYYDYNASTLTRIYGTEIKDYLFENAEDYRLLSVNEEDAYFAVFGRMDSGTHEGENGILVQHYRLKERTIEECAFIRTNLPMSWLNQETGRLIYMDVKSDKLYYLLNRGLRTINIKTGETEILADGLSDDEVLVSSDGSVVAFPEDLDETPGHDRIQLWDLANDSRTVLQQTGRKLQPLSFVGTDFVYGVARPDKIGIAADGGVKYYFSNVIFVKRTGHEEKNYQKPDILVSDVEFLSNTIYLTRVVSVEGGTVLTDTTPDYISYKTEDVRGKAVMSNLGGADGYQLVFPSYIYMTSVPELLVARLSEEEGPNAEVDGNVNSTSAYLFRAGEVAARSGRVGTLVREAAENGGTVLMADGSLLFRQKTGAPYLSVADRVDYIPAESGENGYEVCLTMLLRTAGVETDADTVRRVLKDPEVVGSWDVAYNRIADGAVRGLNISGADLDTAILFLGDGIPFATKLEDRYVLVVSFNNDAIRYYDPIRNTEVRTDRGGFRRKVQQSGDEFYTYVK